MKRRAKSYHLADGRAVLAQEELIIAASEAVWKRMKAQEIGAGELARRLDVSSANASHLLNGERNMTLRTLSDIAFVLGAKVDIRLSTKRTGRSKSDEKAGRSRPPKPLGSGRGK
jgi:plasmid maintenance system antidote protein VapI